MRSRETSPCLRSRAAVFGAIALTSFMCLCAHGRALADRGAFVARFNASNGAIDTSYGFLGVTVTNPAGDNYGTGISRVPFSTKIVQIGTFAHPPFSAGLIGRTHFNGSVDSSFGWLGVGIFDFAPDVVAGKILITGMTL